WVRQRRYQRIIPPRAVPALASSSWGRSELSVRELSLGGGVAKKGDDLRLGSDAALDLQLGLRHIKTQVLLRRARQGEVSFEIVDIDLEDRSKLRRILADQLHRISAPVA
ncbi:MAG TPA: PilZ domain-containing protein, partial [Terriglobales bacterium]|nr:PilZ domain-containing protein [Terriglobales bacterium]